MTSDSVVLGDMTSGRWHRRFRAAWYVAIVLALSVLIASVPGYVKSVPVGFSVIEFKANPSPLVVATNAFSALISFSTGLLSCVLAFLLFSRRPRDRMALFLSFYLMAFGIVTGPLEMVGGWLDLATQLYAANVLLFQMILYPATCFLFLLFPDGRFAPAWGRWLAAAALVTTPVMGFGFFFWFGADPQPVAYALSSGPPVLVLLGVLYAQYRRYRHIATGPQKQQMKWFIYGLGMMLFLQIATAAPYFNSLTLDPGTPLPAWVALTTAIYFLSFAIFPVSVTVAILRYRLYDIDILINRTLVYGGLSAIVILLYVVAVGALSLLFHIEDSLPVSLLVTGMVAVLFQPLREWLQAKISRLMFGERDDPAVVLARLGEHIEANVPMGELLKGILETVSKSLKLPYAAVELASDGAPLVAAEYGLPRHVKERLPLITHGEVIGHLIVSPRSPGLRFSAGERLLLENIARQTGTAVYAGQLYADLIASRQQIVTAREEERRRLRRDLHDGIGPTMASQTLKLDAAIDLIAVEDGSDTGRDLAKATELLHELKAQSQESVKRIRHIVYALRPPALDDLGLIPAIEAHTEQQTRSLGRPRVEVHGPVDGLPSLSAAIEVVVYRIVQEAFTNVLRHAQAQGCQIRLSIHKDGSSELHLEIVDDGTGLPPQQSKGVGITAMRERVEEVGGTFKISSSPGKGTRVWASIPLPEGAN